MKNKEKLECILSKDVNGANAVVLSRVEYHTCELSMRLYRSFPHKSIEERYPDSNYVLFIEFHDEAVFGIASRLQAKTASIVYDKKGEILRAYEFPAKLSNGENQANLNTRIVNDLRYKINQRDEFIVWDPSFGMTEIRDTMENYLTIMYNNIESVTDRHPNSKTSVSEALQISGDVIAKIKGGFGGGKEKIVFEDELFPKNRRHNIL